MPKMTQVSLPTLIQIANALAVSVDFLLCDSVISSKVIFENEAKEIFKDCDEYEIRTFVKLLNSAKDIMRKDRDRRNQLKS